MSEYYKSFQEVNREIYSKILAKKSQINTDKGKNNIINIDLHFVNGLHVKTGDCDDRFGLPNTLYITNEDKDKTIKCDIGSLVYANCYEHFFEVFKQLESMNSFDAIGLFILSDFYSIHKKLMSNFNCKGIIDVINVVANYDIIYRSGFTNWRDLVIFALSTECYKGVSYFISIDKLIETLQNNNEFLFSTYTKSYYYFLDKSVDKNNIYCIDLKKIHPSQIIKRKD